MGKKPLALQTQAGSLLRYTICVVVRTLGTGSLRIVELEGAGSHFKFCCHLLALGDFNSLNTFHLIC